MPSIRTIIIDDEPLARKRISILISDLKDFLLIDECNSGKDALKKIQEKKPDLIFLDIHLADGSSFEIFQLVDIKCPVIFSTAYDDYAIKAFKVNAVD